MSEQQADSNSSKSKRKPPVYSQTKGKGPAAQSGALEVAVDLLMAM
ncbi:MAG: hypothetical protein R3A13_03455 [Bdellovibrionota bacterium]